MQMQNYQSITVVWDFGVFVMHGLDENGSLKTSTKNDGGKMTQEMGWMKRDNRWGNGCMPVGAIVHHNTCIPLRPFVKTVGRILQLDN